MNKIIAIILIALLTPIIILIVLFIYFEDGSPAIFKQRRYGYNNSVFTIFKFRTMKKSTPNKASRLLENPDSYLLLTGKYLRKLSLDEIPNLWNIVRGEMNFVGPRPAILAQSDLQKKRTKLGIHLLKPGITGWAQINGRDQIPDRLKIKYEKEYLFRRSCWFDFKILFSTIFKTIKKEGISH